ncbi:MAG: hypothetical protein MdMp014T_2351 [Treponematales bacterium]
MDNSVCLDIYVECVNAINNGELIEAVSSRDKEFHFQNWFQKRLENLRLNYETPGRNTYPDFCMVKTPEGFELKGLAWPGRERDYDCNSQVPTGLHNGRTIFYVFGRYPADLSEYTESVAGKKKYPVIDLVICHGDFLNADHEYVHKNKSVKGFGSYGDIMIRDRKMYVAPTPFALTEGTTGLITLILPAHTAVDNRLKCVGELNRVEADEIIVGYNFDLRNNQISSKKLKNPSAGQEHKFKAYRLTNQSDKLVTLSNTKYSVGVDDE